MQQKACHNFADKNRRGRISFEISKNGLSSPLSAILSTITFAKGEEIKKLRNQINKNKKKKKNISDKAMASIAVSASLQTVCSSHQVTKQPQSKPGARSLGTKEATRVVALNVEANSLNVSAQEESASRVKKLKAEDGADSKSKDGLGGAELSVMKFRDKRWKNGTWDLNMYSKNGKMDWDGIILAEAKRRKFLELHLEASTNEDPVVFRSSIIPWWAWMMRYYLPEAELINGRAAMVGFFMAYVVDALMGLGVVGQTGNFICKAGFFVTVIAIILNRRTQDLGNPRKLADEATFYDKQWQASWQDQNNQTGKIDLNLSSKRKFVLS